MRRLAIFASGTGSNAAKIISHFQGIEDIEVSLIVSNRPKAGVLTIAEQAGVPSMIIDRSFFYDSNQLVFELKQRSVDFIVLAGFLWLVPSYLIKAYPRKIVNIHPALLPKYGGKGMYGMHVHRAVKANNEQESGISIHFVNERFDEGAVIFQASCNIDPVDSPEVIREKVLTLEHKYFPPVVEDVIRKQVSSKSY